MIRQVIILAYITRSKVNCWNCTSVQIQFFHNILQQHILVVQCPALNATCNRQHDKNRERKGTRVSGVYECDLQY